MDDCITAEEVAEYLNVHINTVYRLASTGKLPATKQWGMWWFSQDEIKTIKKTYCNKRGRPRKNPLLNELINANYRS